MNSASNFTPSGELASDLRALYRASEARAARLRVLVEASQMLAACSPGDLRAVAQQIATNAAHLAGYARGFVTSAPVDMPPESNSRIVPLEAPGSDGPHTEVLVLEQLIGAPSADDLEALGILGQLIGGALAAHTREARLATLLAELLGAQESERSRVAHELHDGVAQTAAVLARRLDLAADGDPADLAIASHQARALVRELRQVIAGMRPPALDDLGLAAALNQLIYDAGLGQDVELDVVVNIRPPAHLETALFRIVQEGINNFQAHAGMSAQLSVSVREDGGKYRVEIIDDGQGFEPGVDCNKASGRGYGLAYMRERVNRLGGRLVITSAPGQGCRIVAELPSV